MAGRGQLRIIGGDWRGRRLPFAPVQGLRPTSDRVRETVFNWLQYEVPGARCLDLFAGSGALGLEALSRGAAETVFVDRSRDVVNTIRENASVLGAAARVEVVVSDARRFLSRTAKPFDIVFLDPPFKSDIIESACADLASRGWLAPEAWIYLERDKHRGWPALPDDWSVVKERTAGGVAFALARRSTNPAKD